MSKTLPLMVLLLSLSAFAQTQTATTYTAPIGSITPTFTVTMNLDADGSAVFYANFPGCYPGPCTSYNQPLELLPAGWLDGWIRTA